jgi:hypothetical protein
MRTGFLLIIIAMIFLISCKEKEKPARYDFILDEKDLIPEGLAFDPSTQIIYVSGTWKKKDCLYRPGRESQRFYFGRTGQCQKCDRDGNR